ncbi:MAG: transposase [Candidatus Didemnitutus sp.]|nr:transposase [Candidatus Didemnitutus sp.]
MDFKSSQWPRRHRPAHHVRLENNDRSCIVFLTVCTRNRQPLLANVRMHECMREAWRTADRWLVGRYVVMPDHVHLFCSPGTIPPSSLRVWVSFWKATSAKASGLGRDLWQQNFWDTQLRRHESYGAKWEYVQQNPVRAGLVDSSDAWPFHGEMNELSWHDAR